MDLQAQDLRRKNAAGPDWAGSLLGGWQAREVRLACSYRECRGLSTEDLTDIYQDTALVLLERDFQEEGHLRNALRIGIKYRALKHHRDERRRNANLAARRPGLHRLARLRAEEEQPEELSLTAEQRIVISEFLLGLDPKEQEVFVLITDGLRYKAIARALGIPVPEARRACRACERKREHFQRLYDTGRLCGYQAKTIRALREGEMASVELAQRAIAHLSRCTACRAEHKTNAKLLRESFQREVAALAPLPILVELPVLAGHHSWLARLYMQAKAFAHRVLTNTPTIASGSPGGVRERVTMLLTSGGIGAKLTALAATVAVIAGGAAVATHTTRHQTHGHASVAITRTWSPLPASFTRSSSVSHSRVLRRLRRPARRTQHRPVQREQGEFSPEVPVAKRAPLSPPKPSPEPVQTGGLFTP